MRSPNGRLLELVRELDALGKEPTLAELGHAMQRVPLTAEDVAAFIRPTPRSYNRVPVVVRDAYDLLVMTWLPGQASAARSLGLDPRDAGRPGRGGRRLLPRGARRLRGLAVRDAGAVRSGPGGAGCRRAYDPQRVNRRGVAGDRPRVRPAAAAISGCSGRGRSRRARIGDGPGTAPRPWSSSAGASAAPWRRRRPCGGARGRPEHQGGPGRTPGSDRRGGGVQHAGARPPAECPGRPHERLAGST